jgi:TMEM175 potassium channel family protein
MRPSNDPSRLHALTDGIFAIAMTIMVLNIDLPDKDLGLSGNALHQVLLSQLDQVLSYIFSFALLGIFWIIHYRHHLYINQTNKKHLWINIFILIFVCLVPYTSNLTSDFPNDWLTHVFFNANMLLIGLSFYFNWSLAARNIRSSHTESCDEIIQEGKQNLIKFIAVGCLALGLSFVVPAYSSMVYLVLFLIMKHKKRKPL